MAHSVGKNAIFSRCKFRAGFGIRNVTEVVYNEPHLVFMGDSRAESLELQLLVLLALAASYALNDSFELFLVQIRGRGIDRQAIFIVNFFPVIISFIIDVVLILIIFHHQLC